MALVMIENPKCLKTQQGKPYVHFWVRIMLGEIWVSVCGWKYYPETQLVSTPSQMKDKGKFFNSTKVSGEVYNRVTEAAKTMFPPSFWTEGVAVEEEEGKEEI